jgi:hypothetical protein
MMQPPKEESMKGILSSEVLKFAVFFFIFLRGLGFGVKKDSTMLTNLSLLNAAYK